MRVTHVLCTAVLALMITEAPVRTGSFQQPQPAPQQQSQPQQTPPAPPQPNPVDVNAERLALDRQRQEQERQRQEEYRRAQERQRQAFVNLRDSQTPISPPLSVRPVIAPVMEHDPGFDVSSIPLLQWLDSKEIEEIPWKVQVDKPALRMDQRLEAPYTATIQSRDIKKLGLKDFYFIAGVSNAQGEAALIPKVVHHEIKQSLPADAELRFNDSVLAQPGEFFLWLVLYDRETGRHNMEKRRVVVTEIEDDPLPRLNERQDRVELAGLTDRENGSVLEFLSGLSLPVANKRPLQVEVISVFSPPEQWAAQQSIVRSHNEKMTGVVNTLAQMRLASGSLSITGLDLGHRSIAFEQRDLDQLDFRHFAETILKLDYHTVSLATLENKGGVGFLRESIERQLSQPAGAMRILVIVSSAFVGGRSADLKPIKVSKICDCRVYHFRIRHNIKDIFDDFERVLKPLAPRTVNLTTPRDFRRVLAEMIHDLESL